LARAPRDMTSSPSPSSSPRAASPALVFTPRRLVREGQPTIHYFVVGPETEAKGAVLLVHGYAEHGARYHHVVEAMVARGYRVAALDLRGHGKSEGVRGHCDRFEDYLGDLDDLFEELNKSPAWKDTGKPVLLGHSFGGLLSFLYGLANPGRVRGTFLSSPFFGIKLAVPAIKRGAAQVLSRVVPTFALPSGLSGRDVTHDPEMVKLYDEDPLNGKGATARWYTETTKAHARALEMAPQFTGPLSIFAAGADRVVSVDATKAVFERVGSQKKSLRVLDGQFHEIFNEVDRETFIREAIDAIDALFQ
jgi:alpha-beta hydrolase superfamily lysophospholipase